jgi:drug/metabolite transporter (DMT)-like permease
MKPTLHKEPYSISEILLPEKYAKLFLAFYILIIPFIIGHIFLFTYVSHFDIDVYSAICVENNSILTWCMGYESFAITLLLILSMLFLGKKISTLQKT